MGKHEKVKRANVQALLIFRDIKRMEKRATEGLAKELTGFFDEIIKNKRLNAETVDILQKVYFKKKDDPLAEKINELLRPIKDMRQEGVDRILLTLTSDGELYAKPKQERCYPLKNGGLRFKLISLLIDEKKYLPGDLIASTFMTSYGTITSAIRKINETARRLLSLPEGHNNDLIISKPRGGYKINPMYPITKN